MGIRKIKQRITQVDFAKKFGISRKHLSQIFYDAKHPSRNLQKRRVQDSPLNHEK
ncbi:MAG: helix-turn-helix transcriptional regulator [Parachlamydiaceae bacterium]|nr:helix-turn-helix transcriptional regulator [Parachlamydiaceae bacterium]